jgi:hypothetical protein
VLVLQFVMVAGKQCRAGSPLRGIVIDNSKSIGLCMLHESCFITIAPQLAVLCQLRVIDVGHGVIHGLGHTGLSLFLLPGGGALAQRFRGEADAHIEYFCAAHFGHIKVRITYGKGDRPVCDGLAARGGGLIRQRGSADGSGA